MPIKCAEKNSPTRRPQETPKLEDFLADPGPTVEWHGYVLARGRFCLLAIAGFLGLNLLLPAASGS